MSDELEETRQRVVSEERRVVKLRDLIDEANAELGSPDELQLELSVAQQRLLRWQAELAALEAMTRR